ncbi:UDP-glucose 4-epimerase [Pseudonocardia sp. N23]|nr:UDP-glucose 4-epimerase [Pseudonocardia sp. N23]
MYGALTGEHGHPRYVPVTEDQPRRPAGLYDVTKVCSEEIGHPKRPHREPRRDRAGRRVDRTPPDRPLPTDRTVRLA